jgi:hypothetical protein
MRLASQIGCKAAWTLRERGARWRILLKALKRNAVLIHKGKLSMSTISVQNRRILLSISRRQHCVLEASIYNAFPLYPIPTIDLQEKTAFGYEVTKLLSGKTWPEVIGERLNYGELDPSLTIWMDALPIEVFRYYLPSHLILASLNLRSVVDSNYCNYVMEALIMPPISDVGLLEELNDELSLEAYVTEYAEKRVTLPNNMSTEQRVCVAGYLSLYLAYRKSEFTERGLELYLQNIEIWKNSSLKI